jgi:hypothetical protein
MIVKQSCHGKPFCGLGRSEGRCYCPGQPSGDAWGIV